MNNKHKNPSGIILLAILMAATALITTCRSVRADGGPISVVGTLVSVKGEVQVWSASESAWIPAKEGALIKSGDKARTKEGSECSIKWLKGNKVKLEADSELEIKKLAMNPEKGMEESVLNVTKGNAILKANNMTAPGSLFIVQAKNTASSMDNASIMVGIKDGSNTSIQCLENNGRVTVHGTNGAAELNAGWKMEAPETGAPNKPEKMTASEIKGYSDAGIKIAGAPSEPDYTGAIKGDIAPPYLNVTQPPAAFSIDGHDCARMGGAISCTVTGLTNSGSKLTINGIGCKVGDDGSFSQEIMLDTFAANIVVSSENASGDRIIKTLTRDLTQVAYLKISASPSQVVGNGLNTVAVSVQAMNLMDKPVDGTVITVTAGAGMLSPNTVTTSGGVGRTTYNPLHLSSDTNVAITAQYQGLTASANVSVLADFPPVPRKR